MRPGSTGGGNAPMGGGNGGGGKGGGTSQGNGSGGGGERADDGRGGGLGGMRRGGMSLRARKKGFAVPTADVAVYVAMGTSEVDAMVTTEVVAMVTLLECKVWDCVTILTFSGRPHSLMPCMSLMV